MAVKDITLGQYFPGESVIHRLDPRVKIIAIVRRIVVFLEYGIENDPLATAENNRGCAKGPNNIRT